MSFQGLRRGAVILLGSQAGSIGKARAAVPVLLRTFATKTGQEGGKKSNFGLWATLAAAGIGAGGGYYYWSATSGGNTVWNKKKCAPCPLDYQKVYNSIAELLEGDYDDGSYGPVLLRLAWHTSGTYDKSVGDGGSNKATMRFDPEASHAGNAGLGVARQRLEAIKKKYPSISYGDLWTLAGVCAVQEMGGPIIPWKPGRVDGTAAECTPDGRLPDGGNPTPKHPRDIFYRMGFNDQEIVALIGAHTLGRCHTDRSGFDGRWTNSNTTFSNSFFIELLGRKWVERNWKGPKQFVDKESGELMMLPADLAFLADKEFKKHVEVYSKDEKKFFEDFAKVWQKMLELGVPFKDGTPEYKFKPTS